MSSLQKRLLTPFIVALLLLLLIDALPETGRFHRRLKDATDRLLDVTGLWQGSWQLYAPDPDRVNTRISADLVFSDGTTARWSQPDWPSLSRWRRFLLFKHMEYFDAVRLERNKGAWSGLAAFLARNYEGTKGPDVRVTKIVLKEALAEIPPPDPSAMPPARPYLKFGAPRELFTWEPNR
jgi:hypothetical protein